MRPLVILLFALLCTTATHAQAGSAQQQINEPVWKPFIKSFSNRDTEGFMAVHSKEMTRVLQDSKQAYGYEKYYSDTKKWDDQHKANTSANKSTRTIELRFIQRIAGEGRAFEVGYYKTTNTNSDGTKRSSYGKFHVLLRQEQGVWKILMDADANERTNETVFMTAAPME